MRFNPDIHRRQSIRLRGFDYASSAAYFVTVVAQGRECLFGDVMGGVMRKNDVGRMVRRVWNTLPDRFPNVGLDTFVVMPNHVHGVLWIHGVGAPLAGALTSDGVGARPTPTLGDVIGAFKSITTVQNIRTAGMFRPGILWQRNYWERIVRDDAELDRIRRYVADNPAHWTDDPERPWG